MHYGTVQVPAVFRGGLLWLAVLVWRSMPGLVVGGRWARKHVHGCFIAVPAMLLGGLLRLVVEHTPMPRRHG